MPAVAPTYGLWLSAAQAAALPATGVPFFVLASDALTGDWGTPALYTELNDHGAYAFAGGLYYAKTGDDTVRAHVASAISALVGSPSTAGAVPPGASLTALSVAKQLPGYVLAADLINLAALDATLEGDFRALITRMLTEPLVNGPTTLTLASQTLPDRWGAWATFAKLLVGVYTGSLVNSLQAVQVFQGLLGDRASYSDLSSPGFDYSLDTSWQADPALPVPLNPLGAARGARSIDGALPDELSKSDGPYHFPFPKDQSAWDMLEALTAMTWVLKQRGTDTSSNQSSALLRAVDWQLDQALLTPSAERQWMPWVLTALYPALSMSTGPAGHSAAIGYSDWTHGPTVPVTYSPPKLTVIYAEGIQPGPEVTPTRWNQFQWGSAVWNGGLQLTSGPPALGLVDAVGMDPVSSTLATITSQAELGQMQLQGLDPAVFLPAGSVVSNADRAKILIVGLDPSSATETPPEVAQGSVRIKGQWLPGTDVTFFRRDLVPEWMREIHDPLEHAKITTRLATTVGAQELFHVTADDNGDVALEDQTEGRYLAAGVRDGIIRYISVDVDALKTAAPSSPPVVEVPPTPVTPPPVDALTARVLGEQNEFFDWLATYNVQGFLGEFGWPDDRYAAGDDTLWNALATAYYNNMRRVPGLWSSQWGASQAFDTYELAPYVTAGGGVGSPLAVTHPQSIPLEAALGDGVRGLAVTGLEFADHTTGFSNASPGTLGVNYFDEPNASWAYLAGRGITLARIGFRWEPLQPTVGGALDPTYLGLIQTQVDHATAHGIQVVLDMHNYGEYWVAPGVGTPAARQDVGQFTYLLGFVDVWKRLSAVFASQPTVAAYGLMNEPHDVTGGVSAWQTASLQCLAGIRSLGDNKLVMMSLYNFAKVQGCAATNGPAWTTDPNVRFEAHHYWDTESSPNGKATSEYSETYAVALADAAANP